MVVAPEYFAGNVELGVIQQAAASFAHVLEDLSLIVNQFESLSEFSAGIDRLFSFLTQVRKLDPDRPDDSPLMALPAKLDCPSSSMTVGEETIYLQQLSPILDDSTVSPGSSDVNENPALILRDLALVTPGASSRMLVRNLNLSMRWGDRLLITGASGEGKSSLLRAIAGLWTKGSGSITRPSDEDVYFLPQRPYCALGSLRNQLLYPSTLNESDSEVHGYREGHRHGQAHVLRENLGDNDLLDILRAVDLGALAERAGNGDAVEGLDAVLDWSNTLSLGEQQRLAFGRILVNQPRFVILDESTSALDVESETRMYGLMKDLSKRFGGRPNGVPLTYISVGHRPTLLAHHDTKLVMKGGSYSIEPAR